ncbi:IclR family transcriptional regulator [Croceicoccus marinus]|uniref:IclR family transcriptional regulator n=1 Tax=Croceicoccus marinus TaxID=450378 RepID=A0A1Z1FGS1_9SPHN|nr:IclR family transcriptional regulator [Croceicoccus marinus]ARU17998.1 IclR family transcriptional regulator [Croceicoccus marinus]QNE07503.1 IclR family transcriptional regulator [Croceicoccus marinus]
MGQDQTEDEQERRYKAPALEKGLDILELLSNTAEPLSLSAIVARLGRSHGELFRMVQVLQFRGYLQLDEANEGYRLTDRLFSLGMQQPRTRNLVETALPVMRRLSQEVGQSCHLALHSQGEIVVVARMESSEQLGFTVRVGYRKPLHRAASGAVLYAFQPDEIRRNWDVQMDPELTGDERRAFLDRVASVRERGMEIVASSYVDGVTDLSAPLLRGGVAAGALTMPFLNKRDPAVTQEDAAVKVVEAAEEISHQLVENDSKS